MIIPAEYTPYAETLRGELRRLGWDVTETPTGLRRTLAGSRLLRLGDLEGAAFFLVELSPGSPFPGFEQRRELYRTLRRRVPGSTLIVCDAAGHRRLWIWECRGWHEAGVYREASEPPRPGGIAALVALVVEETRAAGAPSSPGARIREALARRLERGGSVERIGGRGSSEDPTAPLLAEGGPAETLAVWRALRRLTLLDPDCGDGAWLLAGMAALLPLYAGCLQRMACWLADECGSPRSRSTGFREMARLVTAGGGETLAGADAYLRLSIALNNLHGASREPADLTLCRLRLGRVLTAGGRLDGREAAAIVAHRVVRLRASPHPGRSTGVWGAEEIGAEAWECERAFRIVRDLHLSRATPPPRLAAAYTALARRRRDCLSHARERRGCDSRRELAIHFPALIDHDRDLVLP